ncbi:MAG: hypothetical protein M1828_006369 [Chrysothrix sp. TS-e1954]|nr:MAG: hypothetical protein M1828_006369 [Chrysothrix sp. TS-e1954]
MSNVSADLIWSICNGQNSYLCKRRTSGGVQFSRDPLNLTNKHSRKYEGFVNDQAIGVQQADNAVKLVTKKSSHNHKPASSRATTAYGSNTSSRKIYRSVAGSTAKRGYRADLRQEAIARASAIKDSQRKKKDAPEKKVRGAKARKAAQ